MSLAIALLFLAIGAGLVAIGWPRRGEARPFLRNAVMEMLYPVLCLASLVLGLSLLVAEVLA